MRDSGKASKSAMQGVIKDISDYVEIVKNELDLIRQDAQSLSNVWEDSKFDQFLQHVERMTSSVDYQLTVITSARDSLKTKVGMM